MNQPVAALSVVKGQQLVSLQDLGRQQNLSYGVPTSGAADEYAFLNANLLLNNKASAPALEIVMGGVQFIVKVDCAIAVSGVSPTIELNGEQQDNNAPIALSAGDQLNILPFTQGNYCYLAIAGGFHSSTWFNSIVNADTPLSQQHDYFISSTRLNQPASSPNILLKKKQVAIGQSFYPESHLVARFIPNQSFFQLDRAAQNQITQWCFEVDNKSNKMGYRVNANNMNLQQSQDIHQQLNTTNGELSKPVNFGQIQLPSPQQWIVLMKDRQTMGGYPSIGTVMRTDLFRLAQLRPGQQVSFIPTSVDKAQMQLMSFYQRFAFKQ